MFEFLEYSLEHQLPNFSECWWDHWILDVLICNGGGTVLGLLTLRYNCHCVFLYQSENVQWIVRKSSMKETKRQSVSVSVPGCCLS